MANRTGTYFAFDGLGQTDPTKSDFRYYAMAQLWDGSENVEFKFVNSHEKASSVRDTSKLETLQASIRTRLAASKNMVVIISKDTRKSGSILSWEIEKAVDYYKIPLIISYVNFDVVTYPTSLTDLWPTSLRVRIERSDTRAIHVPFKCEAMLDAIKRFSVGGEQLHSALVHYSKDAHRDWGFC